VSLLSHIALCRLECSASLRRNQIQGADFVLEARAPHLQQHEQYAKCERIAENGDTYTQRDVQGQEVRGSEFTI